MVASDVEVGIGRFESAIDERSSARGSGGRPSVVAMVVVVSIYLGNLSVRRSVQLMDDRAGELDAFEGGNLSESDHSLHIV